jgi:hypothetical protein
MKIVTDENGIFIWKVISSDMAYALISNDIYDVYALYEDDTEALVEDAQHFHELNSKMPENINFGIEVGRLKLEAISA